MPLRPMKNPPHVGRFLRAEVIDDLGLTVTAAAEVLGVTRQALNNLLNGKSALSAEMALRFDMAFGVGMEHLLRMQLAYDMAQARAKSTTITVRRYGGGQSMPS